MGNHRGLCHLTEIGILVIQPLTLHNEFLAIAYIPAISRNLRVSEIFEHVQNFAMACNYPLILRIMIISIAKVVRVSSRVYGHFS